MQITIKPCDSNELGEHWNNFVFNQGLPSYSLGHNPCFSEIFKSLFGYETIHYLIYDGSILIGIFQAIKEGDKFKSLPVLPSSGICCLNSYNKEQLYKIVCDYLDKPYEIRDFIKFSPYAFDKKVTCYLPLKQTIDEQMLSFKSKLRNQIKKGYTNGLEIKSGGIDLLPEFYDIYIRNMHRLGVPHPSTNYFKTFVQDYKNGIAKLFIVTHNSIAVGACIVFTYGKLAELFWASTSREYNYLNPNMVLYWEIIKFSIEQNMDILSFGRSDIESNSLKFKEQWGVETHQLYFNYSSEQSNLRNFKLINKIWKLIPFSIVKIVGPIIRSKVTS